MKSKLPSLPYLIWMAVFIVVPVGLVLYFAFTTQDGTFTIENISQVGQYTGVLLICLLIAYPLAFFLSRTRASVQRTFIMLVMLPMWMNFLLRTYAWMTLLENGGLINKFLGFLGLGPVQMINTSGAVVLGMVYNYLPFMILPLHSIMVKIENTTLEAAQDLGANWLQSFRRVVFPLSLPGVMTGVTMVFVPAISTFIISRMLGGGGNSLIGDLIELQFLGNSYNLNLGSAMSLVLMVIVLLCMSLFNQFDSSGKEGIYS